jgi:hypothetical protein
MDRANADSGTKGELCIYCKSKTYDSIEGINHKPDCPITIARGVIVIYKQDEIDDGDICHNCGFKGVCDVDGKKIDCQSAKRESLKEDV